jgi:drug/metabolite transporter (DMT)-like permease
LCASLTQLHVSCVCATSKSVTFVCCCVQAIGLELSTATKAAFLTQTTAVFTPCLAVLCGQAVLPVHWVACIAALLGSCCITLDSLIGTQQPQQQPVAVEVSAAALPSASSSTGSSSSMVVLQAPALVDTAQTAFDSSSVGFQDTMDDSSSSNGAVAAATAAQVQQEQSAADTEGAIPSALQTATDDDNSSSSSSSSSGGGVGAGTVVPAVTCSPTATPPQGVVHAITCAPVAPSSSSSSSSVAGDGGSTDAAAAGAAVDLLPGTPGQPAAAINSSSSTTTAESTAAAALQKQQEASQLASDISSRPQQQQQQQQQQGLALAAQSTADSPAESITSSWGGEVYILLACCCYAIATVRLSMMAPGLDPVQLATSKTLTLAAASLCWLLAFQEGGVTATAASAVSPAAAAAGEGLQLKQALAAALQSAADKWQMPDSFSHGSGMLLLVYSALGPGALAAVLQAKGQAVASAAEAQVLYSLTPVMSALLAAACLQGEEMGPLAWLGGAVIVGASVGTAVSGSGDSSSNADVDPDNSSSDGGSSRGGDRVLEAGSSSGRRWFGGSGSSRSGSSSSSRTGTRSSSPSS